MSKAFTKEDNTNETENDTQNQNDSELDALPSGKNYITPAGQRRLKAELHLLLNTTRPDLVQVVAWAASNGDRSENGDYLYGKKKLREIDRRIRFLTRRLEAAVIIDPVVTGQNPSLKDRVQFGATVTLSLESGATKKISIVGIDESNPAQGLISWISPLARALLNQALGEVISFHSPKGEEEIEITQIDYQEIKLAHQ